MNKENKNTKLIFKSPHRGDLGGLLLIISLFFTAYTHAQTLPTEGLVAYYPFCGNANDSTGNGHNGTLYGAVPTTDRFGNPNSAYAFDGVDDYIVLPENIITKEDSVFTITFWYKLENDSGWFFTERCENNPHPLVYLSYHYDPGYLQQLPHIGASFHGYILYTNASNDSIYKWYNDYWGGSIIQKNKWLFFWHVFSTKNADQIIYSGNRAYPLNYTGMKALYFGRDVSSKPLFQNLKPSNSFKGTIDDIRIYNRSFDRNKIAVLENDTVLYTGKAELKSNNSNFEVQVNGSGLRVSTKDSQIFDLKIFDIPGNKVLENNNAPKYNIGNLSTGIYVLNMKTKDGEIYNGKIIIKN